MALPGSGTMTLSMIAAEFGGSTPHSLSEYYKGGGLVPNSSVNAAVPTSGTISLSNFYGASNLVVTAPLVDVWSDSAPSDLAVSTINFHSDGTVTYSNVDNDTGSSVDPQWCDPPTAGVGNSYWIRLTPTSGTFTGNQMSTWTQLNTTRQAWKEGFTGSGTVTFTIEIASDAAGSNIVSTRTSQAIRYQHI